MNRIKAALGASLLCALFVCALGVGSASATTLHVCKENTAGATAQEFTTATCETKGAGAFRTVPIAVNTSTEGTVSALSNQVLKATIGGVGFEIVCAKLTNSAGSGKNVEEAGVMKNRGSGIKLEYSSCTVPKPEGQHCKVAEPIKTVALKSETIDEGATMKVKFVPEAGEEFVSITLKECATEGLNGAKPVTGSATALVGSTDPSALEFTTTSGSALKFGGAAATYTGKTRSVMKGTTERLALETP